MTNLQLFVYTDGLEYYRDVSLTKLIVPLVDYIAYHYINTR